LSQQKTYYAPVDKTMHDTGGEEYSAKEHSAGFDSVSHSGLFRIYKGFQYTVGDIKLIITISQKRL